MQIDINGQSYRPFHGRLGEQLQAMRMEGYTPITFNQAIELRLNTHDAPRNIQSYTWNKNITIMDVVKRDSFGLIIRTEPSEILETSDKNPSFFWAELQSNKGIYLPSRNILIPTDDEEGMRGWKADQARSSDVWYQLCRQSAIIGGRYVSTHEQKAQAAGVGTGDRNYGVLVPQNSYVIRLLDLMPPQMIGAVIRSSTVNKDTPVRLWGIRKRESSLDTLV